MRQYSQHKMKVAATEDEHLVRKVDLDRKIESDLSHYRTAAELDLEFERIDERIAAVETELFGLDAALATQKGAIG